jgi:hypothetical protein
MTMHPQQQCRVFKGLAFIAMLFVIVLWLPQPARGGTISMSLSENTAGQSVTLFGTGSQDWAVWGAYGTDSLTATLGKYFVPSPVDSHPINYTLTNYSNGNPLRGMSAFELTELFTVAPDQTTYAGLQHEGQPYPANIRIGEGFGLQVTPVTGVSVLDLYFGVHNGTAMISAYGSNYSELTEYTPYPLAPYETHLYKASFTITGTDAFSVNVTLAEEADPEFRSGNVFLSAASLSPPSPAAVPEIDPSSAGGAVGLLAASLLLTEARRRRSSWQA